MSNRSYLYVIAGRRQSVSWVLKIITVIVLGILSGFALVHFSTRTLVMIGTGILLPIFLIQPAKFLLAYLVASPLLDQMIPFLTTRVSGLPSGPQILFRGGLTVLLVSYWLIRHRSPLIFKCAKPILMLLLLLAITTLSSSTLIQLGITSLAKLAFWMLLLLTLADLVVQENITLETIYRFVMLSLLLLIGCLLLSEFLFSRGLVYFRHRHDVGEITGLFAPHGVALSLSFGLTVILTSVIRQRTKLLLLLLLLFSLLTVISIFRTYARTGYTTSISILFSLSILLWRYGRGGDSRRQRLILGAIVIIIIGFAAMYAFTHTNSLKDRFSDFSDPNTAGSGRLKMYRKALRTYADFPVFAKLFGSGFGASFSYYSDRDHILATHNDYLTILLAGGIVGMFLYIWIFAGLWGQIKITTGDEYLPVIIAGTCIVAYLVAAMTNGVMTSPSVMTYFSFIVGGSIGSCKAAAMEDIAPEGVDSYIRK